MLFTKEFWAGLEDGSITVTFRRWTRPQVKVGGRYHSPGGDLLVTGVERVPVGSITEADAARAGQPLDRLLRHLGAGPDGPDGPDALVHRIEFRRVGDDWRIAVRNDAVLDDGAVDELRTRLARLDRASKRGPWTIVTLRLIETNPGVRAPDLAASVGMETQPFKTDVRKLKNLGLTESLTVGYRLSPRGAALLGRL